METLKQIGRSEIQQGTEASFKFYPIDKLTPPHNALRVNRDQVMGL